MSMDKLSDGSDPVRAAFEVWLSTPKPYMVTQMEMYEAAFKAGRESMHKDVMKELDLCYMSDRLYDRLKELK